MDPKELVDKLTAQIEHARSRPYGRKGKIDRRMGHSRGYLGRALADPLKLKVIEIARAPAI